MKLDNTDGTNQNWHNRPNLLKSKTSGDWASLLKCRMPLSISSSLPCSLYLFSPRITTSKMMPNNPNAPEQGEAIGEKLKRRSHFCC